MDQLKFGIQQKSRHRWLSFSLKSVVILATLFCIWLGSIASYAHRQARAHARLKSLGGNFAYDYEFTPTLAKLRIADERLSPDWLRKLIGEDFFRSVVIVELTSECDATDDDLKALQAFPDVWEIRLPGLKRVTDEGLQYLAGLHNLRNLNLRSINIEGHGLRYLSSLSKLEKLSIDEIPLIDEDLEHLESLNSLKWLDLSSTNITDKGLDHLSKLKSLEWLSLSNTRVKAEGLANLRKSLPNCKVTPPR